ncbi:MAG: photosynthetic complex putative assembly protein PuhB [Kiloniellales bacterium]|nr:photosynthetic complex putative assembly protein PuhB [Kiloniellales bacterium]
MSHDDFDFEPIPGLPQELPPGETILWQGRPDWWGLALRVFHFRKVAIYFWILVAWQGVTALWDGEGTAAAALAMAGVLPIALLGLAILAGLAALYARTTIYTITNKRVILRFGIALPMSVNFPFTLVERAALRACGDGTGDVPLALKGPDRVAYLILWPFARPGRYRNPQPMLRALPEADSVAGILAAALKAELGEGRVHPRAVAPRKAPKAGAAEPDLAVVG